MMPIIAHNLFEMMHVMIGAVRAFEEKCVKGIVANPEKAELWLSMNPIVATALNPLIGYMAAAELVKEAIERSVSIREAAIERIENGSLEHKDEKRLITVGELDDVLGDIHKLTEGGIHE
jgi:fumarate hydratase class II